MQDERHFGSNPKNPFFVVFVFFVVKNALPESELQGRDCTTKNTKTTKVFDPG